MELYRTTTESTLPHSKELQSEENSFMQGPIQDSKKEVKQFVLNKRTSPQNSNKSDRQATLNSRHEGKKRCSDEKGASLKEERKKNEASEEIALESLLMGSLGDSSVEFSSLDELASSFGSVCDLSWITDLVMEAVTSMVIKDMPSGETMVDIVLSSEKSIPEPFCGASMSLVQEGHNIKLSFSNFDNLVQQEDAVKLIENNKGQLFSLLKNLQLKNLDLKELKLGSHIVQLPFVKENHRTPLHMITSTFEQDPQDQREKQQQGHKGGDNFEEQRQMEEDSIL